ncbi:hypothetical protein [Ornithinimicrobium cerasi]|uniref:Uncharacterized protein n=1 Tax=Ornithinimicrobium cerasi TaxID=2248773 RepID=A0A285VFL9_9MICO|nr:hypothetical protein [Ornithinimicrobium cerasi]SOC52747.1 hypothetical protein SAMN05421879_101803 [Ornithinimicrobium cerasi]
MIAPSVSTAAVSRALQTADGLPPAEALPHLRVAAEELTALLDGCLAAAVLEPGTSLRSVAARAGLSENAVGPRLARTPALAAYANDAGRVTAGGVERARYDLEKGTPPPAPPTTPLRFKPRRPHG